MALKLDEASRTRLAAAYEKLKAIRTSTTTELAPTPMLRSEIEDLEGNRVPFKLRYYQHQGVYHLLLMPRMVLGDDTGTGKCVTGDTLLVTDRGLLRISSLAPLMPIGDTFYDIPYPLKVWTGTKWAQVQKFYWNGPSKTKRIVTSRGLEIEGSPNHPVLVRDRLTGCEGFVPLKHIKAERHYVCVDRQPASPKKLVQLPKVPTTDIDANTKRYNWPQQVTSELARLLGYVVAEAWTKSRYTTNVTQHKSHNPEGHTDIRRLFQLVYGWSGTGRNKNKDIAINVSSVWIREHLRLCGVDYQLSAGKSIPWVIFQSPAQVVSEFLKGLFEGEASVIDDGGVEISSASENLLRGVQLLLLRFGIISKLTPRKVKKYPQNTYWRLSITGDAARVFQRYIGFVARHKNKNLSLSLAKNTHNTNLDVVPGLHELFTVIRHKLGNIQRFGNSVRSTLVHVMKGRRNPSYSFLRVLSKILLREGLVREYTEVQSVLTSNWYYDPIVDVKDGVNDVMDLEVGDPCHSFSGNGFINHNTIQALASLCYLWQKENNRAIIVTPKAAILQWASEIEKFTTGIKVFIANGSLEQREWAYRKWAACPIADRPLLIVNYALLIRDWNQGAAIDTTVKPPKVTPGLLNEIVNGVQGNIVTCYDECTAFKNTSTKTFEVCKQLSDKSTRCYGLTATLLKNNLMEGFSIFKVICPWLFATKTRFMDEYCVTKLQPVVGGRKIPIVVGYKHLDQFRAVIDPYFLGRKKYDVSSELPAIVTKEVLCEMSPAETAKYHEALSGVLELGDGELKDYEEHKALVALNYCQQVVNSLTMLKFNDGDDILSGIFDEESHTAGPGAKEQALVDILTTELEDEKVIIYTKYESLVQRLSELLAKEKIKSVRITGRESDTERKKNQDDFQNPKSKTQVIFITNAGSEAINLQTASALVFYDSPWSWGTYLQILGRMVRIGSKHSEVVAYHMVSERPASNKVDRRTIDHHVLAILREKKTVIEKVLGSSAVGALEFDSESATKDLFKRMRAKK